jgi:hypothetical protein
LSDEGGGEWQRNGLVLGVGESGMLEFSFGGAFVDSCEGVILVAKFKDKLK